MLPIRAPIRFRRARLAVFLGRIMLGVFGEVDDTSTLICRHFHRPSGLAPDGADFLSSLPRSLDETDSTMAEARCEAPQAAHPRGVGVGVGLSGEGKNDVGVGRADI